MSAEAKQDYYELVEPRILSNSIIPALLGMMYTEHNFQLSRVFPTIEMCVATVVLQVFMDINDGHWDYKREKAAKTGDHKKDPIGEYHLNPKHVLAFIWVLFTISAVCAILIGFQTNIYIWTIGTTRYAIAISYSTGPHTSSAGPFGKIVARFIMGFGTLLVIVYINACSKVSLNRNPIYPIILAAGIPEICNFTLMLGNNLCDRDVDIANGCHTLVLYIGIKGGLYLFVFNYSLGFLLTGWAIWISVLPRSVALILICIPTTYKNMHFLWRIQTKPKSFPKVVQNTQVLFIIEAVGFFIGLILNLKTR